MQSWRMFRWRSAAQGVEGVGVQVVPGIGGTELKEDPAHANATDGADFEQHQTDRIHLRLGPGSTFQSLPP